MKKQTMDRLVLELVAQYNAAKTDEERNNIQWEFVTVTKKYAYNLLRKWKRYSPKYKGHYISELESTAALGTHLSLTKIPVDASLDLIYMKIASGIRNALDAFLLREKDRLNMITKNTDPVELVNEEPWEAICGSELFEKVLEAKNNGVISTRGFNVILARYIFGFTIRDSATMLGVSQYTASAEEQRALWRLYEYFQTMGGKDAFSWGQ